MQKYLKKVFSNKKSHHGFSLIELVIGILITMVIGAAIMEGTAYYRHKMLSINIKEKTFGELKTLPIIGNLRLLRVNGKLMKM